MLANLNYSISKVRETVAGTVTSPGSTGVATLADIAIAIPTWRIGIGRCSETVVALTTLPSFTPSAAASALACA